MEMIISSQYQKLYEQFDEKSYEIRILQKKEKKKVLASPETNKNFSVSTYTFSDISPEKAFKKNGYILFNEKIAERMLKEFNSQNKGVEKLFVCSGKNSNLASTVGNALNEIFNLGCKKNDTSNKFVYETLIEKAKQMSFCE